jgi:hypothetical protein
MVRMAQPFATRVPLVDGHGNFGSLDGDNAAAYRYTEARLAPLAMELLTEIKQGTVDFRPNFDGSLEEPIVLPAKVPQLLVNGSTGIAVGMATNIPPHHLGEVCQAAVALIDDPALETKDLLKHIKGPDFPTGAQVTNSKKELREIYETGQGGIRVRGEWKMESGGKSGDKIIVTSIPYALSKATLVERIAEVIIAKKLPMLVDVRDESTGDVRIVLEIKPGADPALVMAYLYKHTPLESSFYVNLTCLVPTENKEIAAPMRLDLRAILREFLTFREDVVRRRFQFELEELERRIHVLEGFKIVFDLLDEAIRIIRKSDGKADAAAKLGKRFGLDGLQTEAILELKLYKLARLEIEAILEELATREARAKEIRAILKDKKKLLKVVRGEIAEVAARFEDKRRTKIGGAAARTSSSTSRTSSSTRRRPSSCRATAGSSGRARSRTCRPRACATATPCWPSCAARPRRRWPSSRTWAAPTWCASTTCRPRPGTASRCRSCSTSATASAWWAPCPWPRPPRPRGRRRWRSPRGASACASTSTRTESCRPAPAAASPSPPTGTRWWAWRWASPTTCCAWSPPTPARCCAGSTSCPSWPTLAVASPSSRWARTSRSWASASAVPRTRT